MAVKVDINFDDVYTLSGLSEDKRIGVFETTLSEGQQVPLYIRISNDAHDLLPNVYNLAFGPLDKKGRIDDKAELSHSDYSRVFSTILLTGLNYLKSNTGQYLGVDGSTHSRALLYYRFIQRNFDYLNQYFSMHGLKYYVRISRLGKRQYDDPFDFNDIFPFPETITKGMRIDPGKQFNYFIFTLK